jgi:hypothetical protein
VQINATTKALLESFNILEYGFTFQILILKWHPSSLEPSLHVGHQ